MRTSFLLLAGLLVASAAVITLPAQAGPRAGADQLSVQAGQADELSAARRKRVPVYRGYRAYGTGGQIACTPYGCRPIPRGCIITTGRYWDGTPTGFDQPVCPYR
jgi:hypothetical protein